MKKFTLMMSLVVSSVAASAVAVASPTNQGSNPKGKPFVEIQGQIVEVQGAVTDLEDRIDLLVADVGTIEGQITANQDAIATLQATSASLQQQIDANADTVSEVLDAIDALQAENVAMEQDLIALGGQDAYLEGLIADNADEILALQNSLQGEVLSIMALIADLNDAQIQLEVEVAGLQGDISGLQDQINTLGDADGALQAQIDDKTAEIASLQSQIDANATAIADNEAALDTSRSDLQGQIDQNALMISVLESDIVLIQAELDMKQNVINGVCPDGTAATEVLADGTLVCGAVSGGGGASGTPGQLESYTGVNIKSIDRLKTGLVEASCDHASGYRATGGGFIKPARISSAILADVYSSQPVTTAIDGLDQTTGWSIGILNRSNIGRAFFAFVSCARVAP